MITIKQGNKTTWQEDVASATKIIDPTAEMEEDRDSNIQSFEELLYNVLLPNLVKAMENSSSQKHDRYFSKYLAFTNEHLDYLCQILNDYLYEGKILSTAGSGDQAFMFMLQGATQVDLFDINKMAYYIFALKKAAFKVLNSFEHFNLISSLDRMHSLEDYNKNHFLDTIIHIDEEDARNFWLALYESFPIEAIRELSDEISESKEWTRRFITYYQNEPYNKLKSLLESSHQDFYLADATEDSIGSESCYNIMYNTNILDMLGCRHCKFQLVENGVSQLTAGGILLMYEHARGNCSKEFKSGAATLGYNYKNKKSRKIHGVGNRRMIHMLTKKPQL